MTHTHAHTQNNTQSGGARSQRARLTTTRTHTDTFAPARLMRARTLTRFYHFIILGRDKNCILYPEGGDLCRGSFGSVEIRALSVDHDGEPFFNFKITDEVKEKLPLLPGRIRSFTKFKVSGCSMQLLSDECLHVPVSACLLSRIVPYCASLILAHTSLAGLQAFDTHKEVSFAVEFQQDWHQSWGSPEAVDVLQEHGRGGG